MRQSIYEKIKSTQTSKDAAAKRDAGRMAVLEETVTQYAMVPPKFAKYPLIEDILWEGVQEAMTGKQTPEETLLLMEKQVREVLA